MKSAFDMYIPKMREVLGFDSPKNREEEVKQWTGFSQAIIYRIPEVLPNMKGYRAKKIADFASSEDQVSVGGYLRGNLIAGDGNVIYVSPNPLEESATNAPLPVKKRKSRKMTKGSTQESE